jgi:predicted N-acetyltransferase YhbS
MISIRASFQQDRLRIASFYAHNQYGQPLSEDDIQFFAEKDGGICGALRLCREHGVLVLRGMRIASEQQRKGIGRLLLQKAVEAIHGEVCYCIPHRHLAAFYQEAGFAEANAAAAPTFLADRLVKYREDLGLDVILMRRPSEKAPRPRLENAVA